MNAELPFKRVYRAGFDCPDCRNHHVVEMSEETVKRGLSWTRCPDFPAYGWIRLETEGTE